MDHYYRDNPLLSQYYCTQDTNCELSSDTSMVEDKSLFNVTTPPAIYQTLYAILQGQKVPVDVLRV